MTLRSRVLIVVILLAVALLIAGYLTQRAAYSPMALNTPDAERTQPVYGRLLVGQRFITPLPNFAGIRLFMRAAPNLPPNTSLVLHLRKAGSTANIRTVATTLDVAYQETPIEIHSDTNDETFLGPSLWFPFERVPNSQQKNYDVLLEAPSLTRTSPLELTWQIDSTKYEAGERIVNGKLAAGDFGFVLYEQPQRITVVARWLQNPDHFAMWFGFTVLVFGLAGSFFWYKHGVEASLEWRDRWQHINPRHALAWSAGVCIVLVTIFWPATHLFFARDDIPILARARAFYEQPSFALVTNRDPTTVQSDYEFRFRFFRPLTYSVYPWLMYTAFGTATLPYHIFNLVLFAIAGCALLLLSVLLTRSWEVGSVAALVWAVHSTKLGIIYWWSSVQDLVALVAVLATILLSTRLYTHPTRRTLVWLIVSFTAALLSKEYVVMVPAVLIALRYFISNDKRLSWHRVADELKLVSPLLICMGLFLIVRTIALSDPALPHEAVADETYTPTLSAQIFSQNAIVYSAWSAENWLWKGIENGGKLEDTLTRWLSHVQAEPPYFPGIILLGVYTALTIATWRNQTRRNLLLFAGAWWLAFLLPNLFLGSEWSARWLVVSTWAFGLVTATLLISKPRSASAVCVLLIVYGFWIARHPVRTETFTHQSTYTQAAVAQFRNQTSHLTPETTIYVVGNTPDKLSSVNEYLFRLFTPHPFKTLLYVDSPPLTPSPHDIVIDMRGIEGKASPTRLNHAS